MKESLEKKGTRALVSAYVSDTDDIVRIGAVMIYQVFPPFNNQPAVGYVEFIYTNDEYTWDMYTDYKCNFKTKITGHGIALKFLRALQLLVLAKSTEIPSVQIELLTNQNALTYYKHLGFRECEFARLSICVQQRIGTAESLSGTDLTPMVNCYEIPLVSRTKRWLDVLNAKLPNIKNIREVIFEEPLQCSAHQRLINILWEVFFFQ